jgi:3-hydroxyisobutyrate dehydrogenase-like beta-hydroxyacid dehydrogenase
MSESVGFVGLGAMGTLMASHLLRAGNELTVYNRTRAREETVIAQGAVSAPELAAVTENATAVFSCLTDGAAVESVYLGQDGLLSRARSGQVFVEHGTYAPSIARKVAQEARRHGAEFLDAPITGGPEGAKQGTLTAMVGGDKAAQEKIAPILGAYCPRIEHVGGSGSGVELKLINQLLVVCHVAAYAEAAAMLRALDIPWDVATRVLGSGWAASTMLARNLPRAAEADFDDSGATIGGLIEVESKAAELAEQCGLQPTILPAASDLLKSAVDAGFGEKDIAALIDVVAETGP